MLEQLGLRRTALFQLAAVLVVAAVAVTATRASRETQVHRQNYQRYQQATRLMDEEQKFQEAGELFGALLQAYPGSYIVTFRYGYSLTAAGKHAEALRYYERALELDPYIILDSYYLVLRGDAHYQLGDSEKARVYLEASLKDGKLPEGLSNFARSELQNLERKEGR